MVRCVFKTSLFEGRRTQNYFCTNTGLHAECLIDVNSTRNSRYRGKEGCAHNLLYRDIVSFELSSETEKNKNKNNDRQLPATQSKVRSRGSRARIQD